MYHIYMSTWLVRLQQLKLSNLAYMTFLFTFAVLLYSNSLHDNFIRDDNTAVVSNPDVNGATSFMSLLTADITGKKINTSAQSYAPIAIMSHRLEYQVFGHHAIGYHLSNVLLYAIVVVLTYIFFLQWTNKRAARIAAIIFLTHPMHVDAVANILGRADILCALFYCLALITYSMTTRLSSMFDGVPGQAAMTAVAFGFSLIFGVGATFSSYIGISVFSLFMIIEVVEKIRATATELEGGSSSSSSSSDSSISISSSNNSNNSSSISRSSSSSNSSSSSSNDTNNNDKERKGNKKGNKTTTTTPSPNNTLNRGIIPSISAHLDLMFKTWDAIIGSYACITRLVIIIVVKITLNILYIHLRSTEPVVPHVFPPIPPPLDEGPYMLHNHISTLPGVIEQFLSYGQYHFWYVFKLVYPRHLCHDYGFNCIATVHSLLDFWNILPLSIYLALLFALHLGLRDKRISILVGTATLLRPLSLALNRPEAGAALLQERTLLVPSIGFCLLGAEFITFDLHSTWISISKRYLDPIMNKVYSYAGEPRSFPPVQIDPPQGGGDRPPLEGGTCEGGASTGTGGATLKPPALGLHISSCYLPVAMVAILFAARVWVRNRDWASERVLVASALQVCPLTVSTLVRYSQLQLSIKQEAHVQLAIQAALAAVKILPDFHMTLMNAAMLAYQAKCFPQAVQYLQLCLAATPNHMVAARLLGEVIRGLSHSISDHITHLKANAHANGDPLEVTDIEWSIVSLREEAVKRLTQGIDLGFDTPASIHMVGDLYLDLGREDEAILYYESAIKSSLSLRDNNKSSKSSALASPASRDIDHALILGEPDISISSTYSKLGQLYQGVGNYQDAINSYLEGLKMDPSAIHLIVSLGDLYYTLGRLDEARQGLLRSLRKRNGRVYGNGKGGDQKKGPKKKKSNRRPSLIVGVSSSHKN